MRWLKIIVFINGLAFLAYAFSNYFVPSSFFVPSDAPAYANDAVKATGTLYLPLAIVQLGSWWMTDRFGLRLVAFASLVAAAGFSLLSLMASTGTSAPWHQYNNGFAAGWAVVALIYVWLLYRERTRAA